MTGQSTRVTRTIIDAVGNNHLVELLLLGRELLLLPVAVAAVLVLVLTLALGLRVAA